MSGPVFEGSVNWIRCPKRAQGSVREAEGHRQLLVLVRAGAEPSWEAGRQSCQRSQQCGSHFGRESEAGESESALARPPDQGTVSTSCLFWESEILY